MLWTNLGSIKARLTLVMLISVAGLVLTAGFGILQMSRFNSSVESNLNELNSKTSLILEVQAANVDFKIQVQEWKNILLRGNDPASFEKYKKQFQEQADLVQKHLGRVKEALDKGASSHAESVGQLMASHQEMRDKYLTALESFDAANPEAGKVVDKLVKGVDRAATESMSKLAAALEEDVTAGFKQVIDGNKASYTASRAFLLAAAIVMIVLLLAVILATARRINQSVEVLQRSLAQARQQLDLTVRVPVKGSDELAEASGAINALFEELQSILKGMRQHAEEVAGAAVHLDHSVGQLSGAVDRQNESTSAMAAAAEELAVSIAHVSDSAQTANSIGENSLNLSRQGSAIISHAVQTMSAATTNIQATSGSIEALGQRVQDIGHIANVIRDIADQTNLLALNAAIEAARAGEQGRGFAVVADEVRKLAERTGKATSEIAQVIDAIRADADTAVRDMQGVVTQFNEIADTTRQAGSSIGEIQGGSESVMGVTQDISSALREQSSASDSIARQVEVIASMSESNSAAMNEVKGAAGSMNNLAQSMQTQLAKFVV